MERKETRILAKHFKNAIVNDMACLNGTQFEDLCKVILCIILNEDDILHKGCNLNGKPVSCAVDIKTEDCKIVGQSGTDKDYFSKTELDKPMGDIRGTKKNNPLCDVLYLFSNQRATDAQHTSLVTNINAENLRFGVKIYDAEKIAETIYDNVNSPKCNDVWQYLKEGYQLFAIFPKRNCIPQSSPHYIARINESKELQTLLTERPIVEVVGISGIGKSEFAKQVAKDISQNFDALLWINGCDFKNLDSVEISQFGYEVNLRYVLEKYKSLVVVDNLNENVVAFCEAFLNANKHDSKCIITSLKHNLQKGQTYELPYMDEEQVGKHIESFELNLSASEKNSLIRLASGYPLVVNMICSLVKEGRFFINELLADGALQDLEEEHNKRLSERIVGKIYNQYIDELNLLAYIDSINVSSEFLNKIIKPIRLKYLCLYSILQQDDAYTFRIHQVVLDAIKSISKQPDVRSLADNLSGYLEKKKRQKDMPFFTLFRHNKSFIDKVYQNNETAEQQKKVILYSRLQAENTFNIPSKYLSLINELTLQPTGSLYDCLLLVDKNEIELSATKREDVTKKVQSMIYGLCEVLADTTNEDIKFELLHHIGKLYYKLRNNETAKHYFEQALTIRPKAYATMLQLARIANVDKKRSEAKDIIADILNDNIKGKNVSLTIVLACYSDFLSKKSYEALFEEYIENHFEHFSELILTSLVLLNNQAVRTLATFAYSFAYNKPEFMHSAIELLQELPAASTDKTYIAACANLKAIEYKLEEDKNTEKAKMIFASAKHYFELLKLEEKDERQNKDYQRKRYQELLMYAGDWDNALKFSDCFDDKESSFFYQNLAKIYQNLHDYNNAIENIDKAISTNSDMDYKSSFLWNKACILHDMGDKKCIGIVQEAINIRRDDKAKIEWQKMKKNWSQEVTLLEKKLKNEIIKQ